MSLFEVDKKLIMENDTKYSRSVSVPQYLPKNVKPNIASLMDTSKYIELIRDINSAEISEDEKKFLRFAATRHIKFNYGLIADYYANSDSEIQKLMEKSGLVIIDIDDAIQSGYVKLSARMEELISESKKLRKNNE